MAQKYDADPLHVIPERAKQTDTNLLELAGQIRNPGFSWEKPLGGIGDVINRVMDSNWVTGNPNRSQEAIDKRAVDAAAKLGFNGTNPISAPVANYDMPEIVKRGLAPPTNKVLVEPPADVTNPTSGAGSGAANLAAARNRNDALYAAINRLDDKSFLRFMKDNPQIPGLGYVKDDATGKIVRFAENPDRKKAEPMTNDQIVATAAGLTGAGHMQAGIGARENAAATRQANADYRQEALWEKSNKSVQDLIGVLGKDPNTDQIDPQLAYYKMRRDRIALPSTMNKEDRKSVEVAMEAAYTPVKQLVIDFETSLAQAGKARKATDKEIFALTKAYEKSRGWSF